MEQFLLPQSVVVCYLIIHTTIIKFSVCAPFSNQCTKYSVWGVYFCSAVSNAKLDCIKITDLLNWISQTAYHSFLRTTFTTVYLSWKNWPINKCTPSRIKKSMAAEQAVEVWNDAGGINFQRVHSEEIRWNQTYQRSNGQKNVNQSISSFIKCRLVYNQNFQLRWCLREKHPTIFVSHGSHLNTVLENQHECAVCGNLFASKRSLKQLHTLVIMRQR